ncbi:hypothetical protein ABZ825_31600 [Streptomyces tauricus]|uniref:hypothetical protein n=1 Tax=Streptomyces tauricus TaxID=68274 RepID=UPI0034076001
MVESRAAPPSVAGYIWAFASLTASPGARVHYDRRHTRGDRDISGLRKLFNRMIGCLHHGLGNRVRYDGSIAFPTQPEPVLAAAA